MMEDEQLESLISFYEEEKSKLLRMIDTYVNEGEYQLAHFHQEALFTINRNLQTLKNFDDKLYDEKRSLQSMIKSMEQMIATRPEYIHEFLYDQIKSRKAELDQLNQQQKEPVNSQHVLDDVLGQLTEKKIRGVKLMLKKSNNLFLEFGYSKKKLKVSLPLVKQHIKKWVLDDDKLDSLTNLGFEFTENESRLVLNLAGTKQEVLSQVKTILLRIIFEIFYYKEFENESYIEIREQKS